MNVFFNSLITGDGPPSSRVRPTEDNIRKIKYIINCITMITNITAITIERRRRITTAETTI